MVQSLTLQLADDYYGTYGRQYVLHFPVPPRPGLSRRLILPRVIYRVQILAPKVRPCTYLHLVNYCCSTDYKPVNGSDQYVIFHCDCWRYDAG